MGSDSRPVARYASDQTPNSIGSVLPGLEHSRRLARLIHDVRNPLTALQLGVETLSLIGAPPPSDEVVSQLTSDVHRLSARLNLYAGNETIDLTMALSEIVAFWSEVIPPGKIVLHAHLPSNRAIVRSEPIVVVERALELLLTVLPEGTTLSITTVATDQRATISLCGEAQDVRHVAEQIGIIHRLLVDALGPVGRADLEVTYSPVDRGAALDFTCPLIAPCHGVR